MADPLVLFAEDDREDWILIQEAMKDCDCKLRVERVENGQRLLDRLRSPNGHGLPDVVMLDLQMPLMDGQEALREIRSDPNLRHIPVIVMTTSKLEADIFQSFYDGANSYVVKPINYEDLEKLLKNIKRYWLETSMIPTSAGAT